MSNIIVKHLGKNVKKYLRKCGLKPPAHDGNCPLCDGKLHKHGHYERSVVCKHTEYRIPIYRLICSVCRETVTLLPDFLMPYRIYALGVMESIWYQRYIEQHSHGQIIRVFKERVASGPSKRTLKRWFSFWEKNINNYVTWGIRQLLLYDPFSDIQWAKDPFSIEQAAFTVTKQLWRMTHPGLPYPFYGFFPWINQLVK